MYDTTAAALARSFAALMRGQLYPGSEGDSPYRPFSAPFPTGRLDAHSFGTAARVPRGWAVEFSDATQWLRDRATHDGDPDEEDYLATAEVYRLLGDLMRGALGPRLHLAGAVPPLDQMTTFHRTRRYLVGRLDRTHVVGLAAYSVEA